MIRFVYRRSSLTTSPVAHLAATVQMLKSCNSLPEAQNHVNEIQNQHLVRERDIKWTLIHRLQYRKTCSSGYFFFNIVTEKKTRLADSLKGWQSKATQSNLKLLFVFRKVNLSIHYLLYLPSSGMLFCLSLGQVILHQLLLL